ncbi:MAG: EAL domain-containing protein [Ilumatobacteraceae bacterium]
MGFEALARWPGRPDVTPDAVFAAARRAGRTAELDWACRLSAVRGALEHGLGRDPVLFVNVEPEALAAPVPAEARATLQTARRELRVMIELTERSLVRRPADLLRVVTWARTQGWGIALDDVGAEPASLALLPFLAPDVVKLDA